MSDLEGQVSYEANNILRNESGGAQQIKNIKRKAVKTHCHEHFLSHCVKGTNKSYRTLTNVMSIVAEITIFVKNN